MTTVCHEEKKRSKEKGKEKEKEKEKKKARKCKRVKENDSFFIYVFNCDFSHN